MIPRIVAWLQRHLPNQCLLCLRRVHAALPLCHGCQQDLPWRQGLSCPQCAARVREPGQCGRCLQRPMAFDRAWCVWHYQMPMIHLLHQLKFNQQLLVAKLLGTLMAEAWCRSGQACPEVIIPVPLHPQRLRDRGYNQAAELAKHVAQRLEVAFAPKLVRRQVATVAQATLGATAREGNLRGAFAVVRPIPYQRVVLLDDVMTTGATLHELALTLKSAGVVWVDVWTACRAERRQ